MSESILLPKVSGLPLSQLERGGELQWYEFEDGSTVCEIYTSENGSAYVRQVTINGEATAERQPDYIRGFSERGIAKASLELYEATGKFPFELGIEINL